MSRSRIFYFCYSHNMPTGGQRDTYQHVDLLNAAGYDAFAFHMVRDFKLTWFENDTRTIDFETFTKLFDEGRDVVVLPEDLGTKISDFPGRKVIFNKGLYNGFTTFGMNESCRYPYLDPDVVGIFTVSRHNSDNLKFAFPKIDVFRVYSEIDEGMFSFAPLLQKKKQIVTTHKSKQALLTLFHLLQARAVQGLNKLNEYKWFVLGSETQSEVARILHESLLFIFLSIEEGLPRLPLEAMSCGCIVFGYGGGPMAECLPRSLRFEYGNTSGIASEIELIASTFPDNLARWHELSLAGKRKARFFSRERQRSSVLSAWEKILRKPLVE